MAIWFSLVFPLISMGVMYFLFKNRCVWWEYILPLAVVLPVILLCKLTGDYVQTRDTEFWGGYVTQATYYEDWDERVPCIHEIPCSHTKYCTSTDSQGNTSTYSCGTEHSNDGYYHPYDVDYHPEYWEVEDSNGSIFGITRNFYLQLVKRYGNESFVELSRSYHSNDGDSYVTSWGGQYETLVPTTIKKSYINKVKNSDSIYNYEPVKNPLKQGLYPYPYDGVFNTSSVIPQTTAGADDIDKLNALLGRKEQIRVFVLVYPNKTRDIAKLQERFWKGGNKNELIICIGTNKERKIQWAEVFSWTTRNEIKVSTRDWIQSQETINLTELANWLTPEIANRWQRRNFEEFNYLAVEPPTWLVVLTYILSLIVSGGVVYYAITNNENSAMVT